MALSLDDVGPAGVALVFVAVVIGIGATVIASVQSGQITGAAGCNSTSTASCGFAYNASNYGLTGLDELASWTPTIALVLAAAVVIAVLAFFRS